MKKTNVILDFRVISTNDDIAIMGFQCADNELNSFLKDDALDNQISMLSVTYLVYLNDTLTSYFSLVNYAMRKKLIRPEDGESGYDYSHYPALKIARLAVQEEFERQGIGTAMLVKSISIAHIVSKIVGCRIVTVDAKKTSIGFYERYGFKKAITPQEADTITMYLDLNKMK